MSTPSPTPPVKKVAAPVVRSPSSTGATSASAPAHVHRAPVLSLAGKAGEQLALPVVFSSPVRADLVLRAVRSAQANRRQPYGPSRKAGMRHSVEWSGKGHGVARTPRLMSGSRGAQSPNTVGGRPAHPPRPDAIWERKMNVKERRRALAAALAATREARYVLERGHELPTHAHLPFIFENALEDIESAARAREVLEASGLWADVERARSGIHTRAGKGKLRGRVRRHPRSFLLVVSAPGKARGFRNFPGVDVIPLDSLGTEHLAPGGVPGRLTLFTPIALEKLQTRLAGAQAPSLPASPSVPAAASPSSAPKGGRP